MADYATLLRDHVTLTCRSVDRVFLQAYVPKLQTVGWVCQCLRWQRHYEIPSSAAFGKIGDGYVADIHRWAKANGVPVIRFAKGREQGGDRPPADRGRGTRGRRREGGADRDRAEEDPGVALVEGQGPAATTATVHGVGRPIGFVNHFYFYLWDPEWGGAFWKTCAYAPWPIWICLNGYYWAHRQCDRL